MKEKLHNTPLWMINLLTIVSGIITIITPIVTIIASVVNGVNINWLVLLTIAVLLFFNLILFLRVKKYQNAAVSRMEVISKSYHKVMHDALNQYFKIMHSYKKKTLTETELTNTYMVSLSAILDMLCEILTSFTQKKISACVKLISYSKDEEIIDLDNATLVTFCRSNNSESQRDSYEKHNKAEILLKDNTDFLEIVSDDNNKDYFYQGNLARYDKVLQETGKHYHNSNENWERYYCGTIVVPIRIEFKHLYHQKKDDAYHILGFVCVDSKSSDAFTEQYEKYNVDVVKAYADLIYILLGQYRHYLKKIVSASTASD